MYYCYILHTDSLNKYYIDITDNIEGRLNDHNSGISKWTKNKGPWILVWHRRYDSLSNEKYKKPLL